MNGGDGVFGVKGGIKILELKVVSEEMKAMIRAMLYYSSMII